MPKKKRSRRHKNPCQEDLQIRSRKEDTSINISPIVHNQINNKSCDTPSTDFLSLQSNASLDYSGLKCLFSSRNNCYSSTLIEAHNEEVRLQSAADFISETPRINDFFDLDANLESARYSFVSDFKTPVKRIINTNDGNSATCIQDLNNVREKENVQTCIRTFNCKRLKRLQNFNELVLDTSQGVDYDNAETFIPIELTPPKRYDNVNSMENSFYTPQLYNCKSASTPIETIPIKMVNSKSIGTQTGSARKTVTFSVTKRRTYRTSPVLVYAELPFEQISIERTRVTSVAMCTRIVSNIKTYHGRYSSQLPMKIIDLFTWLGATIKKGLLSLYKLYSEQSTTNSNCGNCSTYLNQMATLTNTLESLRTEVLKMKEENKENCERLHEAFRKELCKFQESIKKELNVIPVAPTSLCTVPPPPPPPPPFPSLPPSLPNIPLAKPLLKPKKTNEVAKPIISLDDILNVKLKKTGDRPVVRRGTEPNLSNAFKNRLKPIKFSEQTPPSNTSILSDSPISSLTRILTVNTNVRRVKRLQRSNTYNSLNDFSRRGLLSQREIENG